MMLRPKIDEKTKILTLKETESLLNDNMISGTIPSTKLNQLRHLEILNVLGNKLIGTIPDTLKDLIRLEEIYLNDNGFTGTVPDSIHYLEKLKHLSIEGNSLQSGTTVPAEVCSLVTDGNLIHLSADCTSSSSLGGGGGIVCTCCTECH